VRRMDMVASYKPVMMLAILDAIDEKGRAALSALSSRFRAFYQARNTAGLTVERQSASMVRVMELDDAEVQRVMLASPFEKFERRKFLQYDPRDLAYIRFAPMLWRQITPEDLLELRRICEEKIAEYYEGLA